MQSSHKMANIRSTLALHRAIAIMTTFLVCSISDAFQISSLTGGINQKQLAVKSRSPLRRTSSSSPTALGMATWSNGQAIKEYQDFLESGKSEMDMKDDGPSVIVQSSNPSSVTALTDAIVALGKGADLLIKPGQSLPASMGDNTSYPIYITIPPYELKSFIQNLDQDWKARSDDFVFFSGGKVCGVVEPTLREFGMCRDATTQVVVGFSLPTPNAQGVTRKPEDVACNIGTDANGEEKWAGESAACGKWNGAIASRLGENGIRCKTVFYREWRRVMWERALYDAVMNVVGAVREDPTDHADVAMFFELEASDMMWEIVNHLRGGLAVTLIYGFEDRLFSIAEMRGKDEPCELTDEMFDYMQNIFPGKNRILLEYLNYAKDKRGLLQGSNVPPVPSQLSDLPSKIRQGNLRADGNI